MTLPAFAVVPAMSVGLVLAQQPDGNGKDGGGQGEDFGKSSPVGLLLLLVFLIAVAFLVRSMTKHLKRLPASFDTDKAAGESEESGGDGNAERGATAGKAPDTASGATAPASAGDGRGEGGGSSTT